MGKCVDALAKMKRRAYGHHDKHIIRSHRLFPMSECSLAQLAEIVMILFPKSMGGRDG